MPNDVLQIRRGHTLFEGTVAIFILGICVAVAAPRMLNSMDNAKRQATIKRLHGDLQYARMIARRTNHEQIVEFSVDDNCYRLLGVKDLDHKQRPYEFYFTDSTSGATLIEADFNGESDLVFQPSGRLESAGTITLSWSNADPIQLEVDELGRITYDASAE